MLIFEDDIEPNIELANRLLMARAALGRAKARMAQMSTQTAYQVEGIPFQGADQADVVGDTVAFLEKLEVKIMGQIRDFGVRFKADATPAPIQYERVAVEAEHTVEADD